MPEQNEKAVQDLINALNEDLAREYQAIYVGHGDADLDAAAQVPQHATGGGTVNI